jgi:anti-sigma regulatory factor (Ser/Thr protein kinase)
MSRAVIDFNVDDTASSLELFVKRLETCYAQGRATPQVIDLSCCQYLGPDAASMLYALDLRNRQFGVRDEFIAPAGPDALAAFWRFSGLAHYLHREERPSPDHPRSETVPLTQVYEAGWGRASPILRLLRRHVNISTDAEEYLQTCFSEVIQNVEDHAQSNIGGVWCARYFSNRGQVRVAVVDHGLGIATTLRRRFTSLADDVDAVLRVLEGGHSSMSRKNNMGLGLSNLTAIVRHLGGTLTILTGHALVEVHSSQAAASVRNLPYSFPGTGVFFVLPVEPAR